MGYKELWQENTKNYNELARKRLDDYCKIEKLDKKLNKLSDLLTSVTSDVNSAKYELRKELNGIYKVMEMNADDIQELQDKLNKGV